MSVSQTPVPQYQAPLPAALGSGLLQVVCLHCHGADNAEGRMISNSPSHLLVAREACCFNFSNPEACHARLLHCC